MIKLGFYAENYVVGGAERYLVDLMLGLDPSRYEITMFSNPNPVFRDYLRGRGADRFPHRVIPILPPTPRLALRNAQRVAQTVGAPNPGNTLGQSLKSVAKGLWRYATALPNLALLTSVFRSQRLDIIHINNGGYPAAQSCRLAALAASKAQIPLRMMTVHSPAASLEWLEMLERRIDKKVVGALQQIITMSASTGRSLQEVRGMSAQKIRMMDLGIPLAPLPVAGLTHDAVRAQFGIPESAVVLGMVGRFDWYKGHCILLEAVRQVIESGQGNDLHVLLVGDGEHLSSVKERAQSSGLSERVAFTGYYPAIMDAVRACDIMAMLSIGFEGQGYVLLEAMSQAKPVIATRVGGQVEVVVNGETGIIVPPSDSTSLKKAICRLIDDPQLREAMGKEGRRRVELRFGLERMLTDTQSLYVDLLSG